MKKDKKWLKNEVSKNWLTINGVKIINPDRLNPLIDQLDEPPKVAVPKWFDEWVKSKMETEFIYDCLDLAHWIIQDHYKGKFTSEQRVYIANNPRDILSALLNGYEVEEIEVIGNAYENYDLLEVEE